MHKLVNNAPIEANISILEDEPRTVRNLEEELQKPERVSCRLHIETSTDIRNFIENVKSKQFDIFSIDWELHKTNVGPEALEAIIENQPNAARIVYTKHKTDFPKAKRFGADGSLLKEANDNLDEYVRLVKNGIRLGFSRQICAEVHKLGSNGLPNLPSGQMLDENTEMIICDKSREVAYKNLFDNKALNLIDLLTRRNWWRTFSSESYVKQPIHKKLSYLLELVEENSSTVSKITGANEDDIVKYINDGSSSSGSQQDHLYSFVYILGFMLRLTGYQPELMLDFWRLSAVQLPELSGSPWSNIGFAEYLKKYGPLAIEQCVIWIRKNS